MESHLVFSVSSLGYSGSRITCTVQVQPHLGILEIVVIVFVCALVL